MAIAATYVSATQCTMATDRTVEFGSGVRVQAACGTDGTLYGTVTASSYVSGTDLTTVTLALDSGSLTPNLTGILHGNDTVLSLCNHAGLHAVGGRDVLTPAAIGALGLDVSAEITISAATTLTTAAFGKIHRCSGTTTDYDVVLPAVSGKAGKIIGIRIATTCTRLITLNGYGGELIDGSSARVMWAGEVAILLCDGTAWIKIGGKPIPMQCIITTSTTQSIPNTTTTTLGMDTVTYDIGGLSNLPANCIKIRRGGLYALVAASSSTTRPYSLILETSFWEYVDAFTSPSAIVSSLQKMSSGDTVIAQLYQSTGNAISTYHSPYSSISAVEMPSW